MTPEEMAASMRKNIKEKTGKAPAQWAKIVATSNLEKHGQIVKYLKSEHGITHGFANLIAHDFLNEGKTEDRDLVDLQYQGDKQSLRPIYETIVKLVQKFGDDIEISPKKAYVSLRRKKQFAIIQASTKTRVDVGINLKDAEPTERLLISGSFNKMVSHRVKLSSKGDVDEELREWLLSAYKQS